jgi:hypothetical protein
MLVEETEIKRRHEAQPPFTRHDRTPWQIIYRDNVGQLDTGGCFEMALAFRRISSGPMLPESEFPDNPAHPVPRHSH